MFTPNRETAKPQVPPARYVVFRNLTFVLLWLALAQSALGDQVYRVSLSWYTTSVFHSVLDTTLIGAALAAPMAVIGLLGGVLVDRLDRFKLLVSADVIRMIITATLAGLVATRVAGITGLVIGSALLAVPSVVYMPAIQTVLPDVSRGDYDSLIVMDALIIGAFNVVTVVGGAVTGALLAVANVGWLLGFDALTFGVSALVMLLIAHRIREQKRTAKEIPPDQPARKNRTVSGMFGNAREGISFIWRSSVLRPQFLVYPVLDGAQYAIAFLLPALLRSRGSDVALVFGLSVGAMGLGRVSGLTIIAHTPLKGRRGVIIAGNFLAEGVGVLFMLLVHAMWIAPLAMFLIGLPAGATTVAVSTYVQSAVPDEIRGRVFAGLMALSSSCMPVAPAVLGAIAAVSSPSTAMVVIAGLFIVGGGFVALHPEVRQVR
jgi:MFS family permease